MHQTKKDAKLGICIGIGTCIINICDDLPGYIHKNYRHNWCISEYSQVHDMYTYKCTSTTHIANRYFNIHVHKDNKTKLIIYLDRLSHNTYSWLLTLMATVTINIADNHLYIYTGTTYIADKQMNMHHSC